MPTSFTSKDALFSHSSSPSNFYLEDGSRSKLHINKELRFVILSILHESMCQKYISHPILLLVVWIFVKHSNPKLCIVNRDSMVSIALLYCVLYTGYFKHITRTHPSRLLTLVIKRTAGGKTKNTQSKNKIQTNFVFQGVHEIFHFGFETLYFFVLMTKKLMLSSSSTHFILTSTDSDNM